MTYFKYITFFMASLILMNGTSQASSNSKICKFHGFPYEVVPFAQACPIHRDDTRHGLTGANPLTNISVFNNQASTGTDPASDETDQHDDHVDSSSCYHFEPFDDFN